VSTLFGFVNTETRVILNVKRGNTTIIPSHVRAALVFKNKSQITLQVNNKSTYIKEFTDSARIKVMFGDAEIESPLLSYFQFTNIERIEIVLLNDKQIKKKYLENSKYKTVKQVLTMRERPKNSLGDGFFVEKITSYEPIEH